ncbi:hypothetical protein NS2R_13730 [Pseudomonas oryzihabitans]|nr:hypothetical protein NS2R_13730 [Pseudomonas psychrotolerans]
MLSSKLLLSSSIQIALESIWMDSGYKDWMYRVDPEDPRIPLKRHVHIAKKKHTSTKNMQASWNADGTRHDQKSFNTSVGNQARVKDIARNVLGLPSTITLESADSPHSNIALLEDISFSSDGKVAYIFLNTV